MVRGIALSLRAQRRKLEAKLRAIKGQEQAEANRRLIVAGRAVLAHAETDPAFRNQLHTILTEQVKKKRERQLFALDGEGTPTGDGGAPPAPATVASSSL